jgi:integrase
MGTAGTNTGIELHKGAHTESIRIYFTYRGVECREPLRLAHTKQNIAYAVRRRGEILNAIKRGTFVYHEFFPNSPKIRIFDPQKVHVDTSAPAIAKAAVTVGQFCGNTCMSQNAI